MVMKKFLLINLLGLLSFKYSAYADGMPDYKQQIRYIPKKEVSGDRFSIAVLAGINIGKIEHISRNAQPSSGAFFLVKQPNKPKTYIGEISGFYRLKSYPISVGMAYTHFGKNKYKASPTFIESGGMPDNPGYTQEISAHDFSLNLKYHMNKIGHFEPFIGFGAGFAKYYNKLKLRFNDGSDNIKKNSTVFTQNLFLGTNYKINQEFSIIGQAKYTHFNQLKNGAPSSGDSFKISGVHNFSFTVGLEYKF